MKLAVLRWVGKYGYRIIKSGITIKIKVEKYYITFSTFISSFTLEFHPLLFFQDDRIGNIHEVYRKPHLWQ